MKGSLQHQEILANHREQLDIGQNSENEIFEEKTISINAQKVNFRTFLSNPVWVTILYSHDGHISDDQESTTLDSRYGL